MRGGARGVGHPLLVAAVVALLVALTSGAVAQEADRGALERARRQVAEVEAQLANARAEQADADRALAEADAQLAALEAAVNEAAAALERQQLAVDDAAQRVAALEADVVAQQEAFATRAVDLYKRGAGTSIQAILEAGSIGEAIDRGAYVQALSASDTASLESIVATRTAVDAERVRLAQERDRLATMKTEQEALLADVARLREHRALQAAAARANVGSLAAQHADLSAESRRIAQLIQEQEQAARAARASVQRASASAGSSGGAAPGSIGASGYAWPRCDRVNSEFGRRWGRMHEGLDIDGNTGDPVYAAKAGVVSFAGTQGGYGRMVLINHGDGVVTAYAHLSAFAVSGGAVAQGQRIGSVGTSGNVTGAHLHFETRVHGSAVNPRRLLPSSC